MQIILLDKVVNLGNLGEIVKVKDGYARNFLIPSGPRPPRHRSATRLNSKPAAPSLKKPPPPSWPNRRPRAKSSSGTTDQAHAEGWRRRPPVRLGDQRTTSPKS